MWLEQLADVLLFFSMEGCLRLSIPCTVAGIGTKRAFRGQLNFGAAACWISLPEQLEKMEHGLASQHHLVIHTSFCNQ
jgi:hypothetical protein